MVIKDLLLNTDYSKKEIMQMANASDETIRKVNLGLIDKDESLIYPLR